MKEWVQLGKGGIKQSEWEPIADFGGMKRAEPTRSLSLVARAAVSLGRVPPAPSSTLVLRLTGAENAVGGELTGLPEELPSEAEGRRVRQGPLW